MVEYSSMGAVDQQVCWEQIDRTGHPFGFTRIFADRLAVDRLLAVYAFCAIFERLACETTDEEVAFRKLEWWRFQCVQQGLEESKHPVVRELVRTSAHEGLELDRLSSLVELAAVRIDARPVTDEDNLRDLIRRLGSAQLQLEASVFGYRAEQNVETMGLAQLIRESSSPNSANPFWWVPMNLLAAHGLSRGELTGRSSDRDVSALLSDLLAIPGRDEKLRNTDPAPLHGLLMNHLCRRQLARCRGKGLDFLTRELNRLRLTDVVSIWRQARSLR